MIQFTDGIDISPTQNQIGVILFSDRARLLFGLNAYTDKTSLVQAVRGIPYIDDATNIPDALCQLITSYTDNSLGARLEAGVFQVAILMTDGQSNRDSNPCGFSSVSEAANAVRTVLPQVTVFAFGVGDEYNEQDVINIASRPDYVGVAQSFDLSQLLCVQAAQENDICFTSKMCSYSLL